MKRTFAFYAICTFCILHFSLCSSAQNFLWGRSGGSVEPGNGPKLETIRDMATDRNGNVYILTHVMKQGMNIAGLPIKGYGGRDVLLASFKPDGTLRWKKLIGNGDDERSYWLGTDNKDGVYFSCEVSIDDWPANIDTDATTLTSYLRFILVKYDTAGNFQWYRHPEADTLSTTTTWSYNRSLVMDVDDAGNTYWLMQLYPGVYGNGALVVPALSMYLIKYSASGSFSYIKPSSFFVNPMGAQGMYMTLDDANGRFYLSGGVYPDGVLTMAGDTIKTGYIGCFKLDGSFLWKRTFTSGGGGFGSRAAIDGAGNVYLAGSASGKSSTKPPAVFNGYTATHQSIHGAPFVTKMDKNGNHIWSKDADAKGASCSASAIALRGKEVVIAGSYAGPVDWPGFVGPGLTTSDVYDVFITRFDTSNGWVWNVDRMASTTGSYEYPARMVSDGKGNVYIGGDFGGDMVINAAGKITSTGGDTDWFLVKYGDMWPASVNTTVVGGVKIYPNPATDLLTVEGAKAGMQVTVLNLLGQQVYHGVLNNNTEVISISQLPPGNYALYLTGSDGSRSVVKVEKL
ncbi:T9SS type A sorting domain-containing protein [Polluticoccus soli]|uniref:T9SS type A sorting domain-containing protein n=1 Tax=Polluticoccus soli TaxID=3034150 RepID=UPI0023E156EB|nr:T9SS type A sorting domain-containing protein [Flavipsychrobacter sp. JY13-12]